MHNWEKTKYDPKNPTFSSSFFNKFNKSLKTHYPITRQIEDYSSFTTTSTRTPKSRATSAEDEKMSSLRRTCLVEKWMEKKVTQKVSSRGESKSSSRSSSTTLLEEFDLQDTLFFSSTTTTTTSSSSSSFETEYSVFPHSKHKPRVTCFAPPRPKPIKTHSIESNFLKQFSEENDENFMKSRSKAAKVYSNLKNLKQPISPGVRLTNFINSLFTKDGKNNKKSSKIIKQSKTEESPSSTCSSASSFSRSCLSKNKKFSDDGIKRTVRFCPVSVIVDDDSQPCGYKSLREEREGSHDRLSKSKFGRSLSKRYEELRKLNGMEREGNLINHQKKLEEVALDLLSGYWDARLNKSHDLCCKDKDNNDDYGDDHGVNYDQHEDEDEDDDDDDGGFSCSSSDLFELDNLSLIGNELPVYETTQFDNKIM